MEKLLDWLSSPKIIITRNLLKLVGLVGATVNSFYCMHLYACMPYLLLLSSSILLQVLTAYFGIVAAITGAEAYQNGHHLKRQKEEAEKLEQTGGGEDGRV